MIKHKQTMKDEMNNAVLAIFEKYRVNSHREKNEAIDGCCAYLQSLKHNGTQLLTTSEFLDGKEERRLARLKLEKTVKKPGWWRRCWRVTWKRG